MEKVYALASSQDGLHELGAFFTLEDARQACQEWAGHSEWDGNALYSDWGGCAYPSGMSKQRAMYYDLIECMSEEEAREEIMKYLEYGWDGFTMEEEIA